MKCARKKRLTDCVPGSLIQGGEDRELPTEKPKVKSVALQLAG